MGRPVPFPSRQNRRVLQKARSFVGSAPALPPASFPCSVWHSALWLFGNRRKSLRGFHTFSRLLPRPVSQSQPWSNTACRADERVHNGPCRFEIYTGRYLETKQSECHPLSFNPFNANKFSILVQFQAKSSSEKRLSPPKLLLLRTLLHVRVWDKLELKQEVGQHPTRRL